MSASIHEQALARVKAVLLAAGTAASDRVTRGRVDAFAPDECPGINVRRATGQFDAFGNGADHGVFEFELDHFVRGDDWETSADALHMQAHIALAADAQLKTLIKGLRCTRTEPYAEAGDQTLGRLRATYQGQAITSTSNLGQALR